MNTILRNIIIAIIPISLIIFGINAFAHSGMGWGHHGFGWHHQDRYYADNTSRMSPEEYQKIEQAREEFFKDTQGIRDNLYEKSRALENELAKVEPDAAKAAQLQKDISKLQSQFDEKRIAHMIEMRKLNPDFDRGYMDDDSMMGYGYGGHMMGYGYGGHMMDYGYNGDGSPCWR